jgi:K+-transporting ATPase KdpF subunit
VHDRVFCGGYRIRFGLRTPEIGAGEMLGNALLLGICVLMLVYLLAALLWPEKF